MSYVPAPQALLKSKEGLTERNRKFLRNQRIDCRVIKSNTWLGEVVVSIDHTTQEIMVQLQVMELWATAVG